MERSQRIELLKQIQEKTPFAQGYPLLYRGERKSFDVWEIPMECLIYNQYNGRIGSVVKSYEKQNHKLDPELADDAALIEKFLWQSKADKNEKTMGSLRQVGQLKFGIVTSDGVIVDGNRRASLMNRILRDTIATQEEKNRCKFFRAVILPKNKNSTELCKVVFEARLTLLPYSPETSELLKNDRANGYNKILSEKKSLKNDAQESELKNLMQNNLILIVEDNIALLKNIAELLKPYCPVITATNGKDAICKIKKNAPDLIISDMVMPVMGGKAFFDFCRGDENLKNVPFLFLTGVQDVALKNSFIKQGVVDYIFKPFSQEELLLKIYSILSLCVNVRKDFARTITDFVNKSTAGGMHRGISFMEKEPEENHISQKEKRHEYYKTFNLSKREVEISELLYENHSNKEIAETLFIAVSTVATHIQHIYEKCGVRNRNEWIRLMSGG